ncbi:hypothetical protein V8G54_021505 [Vigna mungo]|uniref:Uncharacterized protein n=1 Tax=Vigna mungo TaxID=3915 RepID=A0AAQ3NDK7_VIGMU
MAMAKFLAAMILALIAISMLQTVFMAANGHGDHLNDNKVVHLILLEVPWHGLECKYMIMCNVPRSYKVIKEHPIFFIHGYPHNSISVTEKYLFRHYGQYNGMMARETASHYVTAPLVPTGETCPETGPLLLNDEEKAISSCPSAIDTVSFFLTCLNGLNTIAGVCILSTPYALAIGGWLSLVLLFSTAAAAIYISLLIKRYMDKDSNIRTYLL